MDPHKNKAYLEENERQFDIPVDSLLNGESGTKVYRKIVLSAVCAIQDEEAWTTEAH